MEHQAFAPVQLPPDDFPVRYLGKDRKVYYSLAKKCGATQATSVTELSFFAFLHENKFSAK
jgi:hypothetical protein